MLITRPHARFALESALRQSGSLHEWAAGQPGARRLQGRGAAWLTSVGNDQWVVRHGYRGGAVAHVLDDRYARVGEARPARELAASEAVRARGVRTPRVVAFAQYVRGPFYRFDMVTDAVDESIDLAEASFGALRRDEGGRIAAWRAAGELLRATFDAGVVHADLNLKNVLIAGRAAAPEAWLLDLDRCAVRSALTPAERERMLDRFDRSRRKHERLHGPPLGDPELDAFNAALDG